MDGFDVIRLLVLIVLELLLSPLEGGDIPDSFVDFIILKLVEDTIRAN